MLSIILLVFAFVLAFIAAFFREPVEPHRARLIAASLAFFYAALLFGKELVGKYLPIIILIPLALSMGGCAGIGGSFSDPKSAESQLASQAFSFGLTKITGRAVSAADVDGAAALIRTLAGKKDAVTGKPVAPTKTEIELAAKSGTDSPPAASGFASQIASLMSWAMSKNIPPDKVVEITSKNLNDSAAISRAP